MDSWDFKSLLQTISMDFNIDLTIVLMKTAVKIYKCAQVTSSSWSLALNNENSTDFLTHLKKISESHFK